MERAAKILAVVGFLVLCGSAWATDGNEPIAHWKFDEGSGTTAYDSVGDNHGTVHGAVWTAGQIDGALSFDGVDDYVDCGTGPAITGTSNFAVSAWVKVRELPASGGLLAVVNQRSTSSANGSYIIDVRSSGHVHFEVYNGGYGFYFDSDVNVGDGFWHHIVGVRTSTTDGEIYVDGSLAGSGSGPAKSLNNVDVVLGRWNGAFRYFDGLIDDVRIYDRALSAEELEQLYQEGLAELAGLEIIGPEEVAEDFQAQYAAIAYYDNNSTRDVTDTAQWSVEPDVIASIDSNGLLTTEEIYILEEDITIHAQYTEDTNTFEAEKAVSVFAVCPKGTALQFDGEDDYVRVPRSESLEPGEITVEMWALLDGEQTANTRLLRKAGHLTNGYILAADQSNNRTMQFRVTNNGTVTAADTKSHTVYVGEWHHFAGVYTRTRVSFYVDGHEVSTISHNKGDMTHNPPVALYIGHGAPSPMQSEHFKGKIDEVRIWNAGLTQEQIQSNLHILLSGDEPNLVGYWDFDEGEGQVAYDLSSNGNNGYLGSDPCDVDDADPAWIDSDAPVGICTTGGLIERNISRALESKQRAIEEIEAALTNENATIGVLEELFESRDYGDLNKGDIVTAKQKIHSAIQHEEQSMYTLEKSIEKLEDSLSVLGCEVEPNGGNN